jgi:selenide, water dikinase
MNQQNQVPIIKDLLLLGGGHSHLAVLKRFGMKPLPGVRLTLITRDVHTPYSGMLPGLVAGHYQFDEAHIDLRVLGRFARARLIHDEAIGLDPLQRQVVCRYHPPISYDLLSIDIGSTPRLDVPGAEGNVVPVKPINQFLTRWQRLAERTVARGGGRIAVVGAGAGGVEVLLAVQYRLQRLLNENGCTGRNLELHLFTDTQEILPAYNARIQSKFRRVLAKREVTVHTSAPVVQVAPGRLTCTERRTFDADEILWVAPAGAAPWLHESGIALDARGFIVVNDFLQSISHPEIFAAGDVAIMQNHPRPRAGVFAVRQGKPLARNLRLALCGQSLRPFAPQREFLSLISTGDQHAVASRNGLVTEGAAIWRWKDRIDRRFMRKYSDLPEMSEQAAPPSTPGVADEPALREISAIAMRCGGCGAKIGATVLEQALRRLRPYVRDDILIGLDAPDDAAVATIPAGKVALHTVDYFRAFIDDPYTFGQIAANHALSDIFAMGGEPQTALAIVTMPYGIESKLQDQLFQLMAGALKVFEDSRTALVGGHTSEGAELALGFAINGIADPARLLRKGGMRPGDCLMLTKPLGTGTLFAAEMRGKAKARWIEAALASMTQSNRAAAECLWRHSATACTDITGFGLIGHLVEMLKASELDVELDPSVVPLLDGALETVRLGIFSSLQPQNIRLRRAFRDLPTASANERFPLLFDPQTSGGLLASVPANHAASCLAALHSLGCTRAAIIGRVLPRSGALEPITLAAQPFQQELPCRPLEGRMEQRRPGSTTPAKLGEKV